MTDFQHKTGPRTKPNYLYVILSVALVLFLLGFFGLMLLHANRLVRVFKERVNLMAEMREGTDTEAIAAIQEKIARSPFTKAGSVTFVSKEEAARLMSEDFGEDFLKLDLPNPFFDVITFNVKASYVNRDSLERIREQLLGESAVADVYFQESLVDNVSGNIHRIGLFALGLGIFFIVVAITLIHNTIRLALFANRFLIKNMELVGASWSFISRPFLVRALRHGILSAALAVSALILFLNWAQTRLPELRSIEDMTGFILLFSGLIILGMLISIGSTYYVVRKYLSLRMDDLY